MTPIDRLRAAITDEGVNPDHHRRTMTRHRAEWPTLWHAIDAVLAEPDDRHIDRFGSRFPR